MPAIMMRMLAKNGEGHPDHEAFQVNTVVSSRLVLAFMDRADDLRLGSGQRALGGQAQRINGPGANN